jgi:miniconductance mechanosensitive channel
MQSIFSSITNSTLLFATAGNGAADAVQVSADAGTTGASSNAQTGEIVVSQTQEHLSAVLDSLGVLNSGDSVWWLLLIFAGVVAVTFILAFIVSFAYRRIFGAFVAKTKTKWDDLLFENRAVEKFIAIIPFYLAMSVVPIIFSENEHGLLFIVLHRVSHVLVVAYITRFVISMLDYMHDLIEHIASHRNKPLAGFVQGIKIIVIVIAVINILAVLIDKDPQKLLLGLGASAAILTLVFKDTILGLVAGVQFSAYDMLRVGDWITMPKYDADGDVIQIGLNSIKVRNFDNTITTIPTYTLVSDSFQNWRGMSESGGRRVKRSVSIDMRSVKFCTDEMLVRFGKIRLLKDYLAGKQRELEDYNSKNDIDNEVLVNGRRQTNLGVFRAYVEAYLRTHPLVNHKMTCMVRQLQPTEKGLPLELYFFTDDVRWIPYENIQSDVFDHILSIIPEFDLHVFQNISGSDLAGFSLDPKKD